ncbi:SDR family NAD(P)-dependent oxidoreductase [Novosphingobium kaempferiae]|uniref:SDR family NAD(P)-dependent oxidoreductase n=1 Tax=Novosphingobium kaempferiae TaxID=2896849 RepID=UPI001E3EAAC0|nr:SDR family NAD(P)-dependent oxidoreductase [Novosphingobium kaempferiae]
MEKRRTAIVVGAAGGIGRAVCSRFASEGLRVIVIDRDGEGAEKTCKQLAGEGHEFHGLDVTMEHRVNEVFDEIERREPAGILVVVAGGPLVDPAKPPTVAEMSTSEWNDTLALNISGAFYCVRKFAQLRIAVSLEHARIVTLGSVSAQIGGAPTGVAYVASKAAVMGMTRQAAAELATAGITVNCVSPGPISTPAFFEATSEDAIDSIERRVPLGRIGTPDEIAAAVSFLCSTQAAWITGTTLDVNGGVHMR